jgi:hypothetical protein
MTASGFRLEVATKKAGAFSLYVMLFAAFIPGCEDSDNCRPITESFLGQPLPGESPTRFAEEIITDGFYPHSRMIISPADDKIYWTTFLDLVGGDTELYYSSFRGGGLAAAEVETTLSKEGIKSFVFFDGAHKVLFGGLRPHDGSGRAPVRAVWMTEKTESGWSQPEPIESTIDANWASLGSVSFNNRGDIYFSGRREGGTAKIYCTKYVDESYQACEVLPVIINTGIAIDPFVDYQDNYLLFAAAGRTDNIGVIDLYVSFKDGNGDWGEPSNLGRGISTEHMQRFPMVTNDGRFLFFVTSHSNHFPSERTHFYWMDAKILKGLRGEESR